MAIVSYILAKTKTNKRCIIDGKRKNPKKNEIKTYHLPSHFINKTKTENKKPIILFFYLFIYIYI